MEENKHFEDGDRAFHPIYGECLVIDDKSEGFPLALLTPTGRRHSITYSGAGEGGKQTAYRYPVRVTPISEFEEGELIEVSDDEDTWDNGYFVHKFSTGQFIVSKTKIEELSNEPTILSYYFARKITKPEKTISEIKDEIIDKQSQMLDELLNSEISSTRVEKLKSEISSLQEQIKQKS